MTVQGLKRYPIIYTGSVKNLRQVKKASAKTPGVLWFEYTDDYSVFDYGKMPDAIPNKGASAAMLSAFLFEKVAKPSTWRNFAESGALGCIKDRSLQEELFKSPVLKNLVRRGLTTHYQGIVNENGVAVPLSKLKGASNVLQVAAVRIIHPNVVNIGGRRLYNYTEIGSVSANHLIPLECVFRFGAPRGSSLFGRLESIPGYAAELGLSKPVKEGADLPRPILELFSKLEPADRFLPYEFAMNVAGLSGHEFLTLLHSTLLVALWLREEFARIGIKLWDGKFEFLRMGGDIVLGDAITPDELRLTYKNLQISKEPLRQFHKLHQPKFIEAMNKAKKAAERVDRELRDIVTDLGAPPQPLPEEMIRPISDMYAGITERMLGRDVFGGRAGLGDVSKTLKALGVA